MSKPVKGTIGGYKSRGSAFFFDEPFEFPGVQGWNGTPTTELIHLENWGLGKDPDWNAVIADDPNNPQNVIVELRASVPKEYFE